jgi:hypothetical protein
MNYDGKRVAKPYYSTDVKSHQIFENLIDSRCANNLVTRMRLRYIDNELGAYANGETWILTS